MYDPNDGVLNDVSFQEYDITQSLMLPAIDPTRDGWIFSYWDTGAYMAVDFMNLEDLAPNFTLTAVWDIDPNWFTVTYDSAGGTYVSPQKYSIDGEIVLPTVGDNGLEIGWYGHDFVGWYLSTIPTLQFIGGEAAGNITLVAHWTDWAQDDPRWGP